MIHISQSLWRLKRPTKETPDQRGGLETLLLIKLPEASSSHSVAAHHGTAVQVQRHLRA